MGGIGGHRRGHRNSGSNIAALDTDSDDAACSTSSGGSSGDNNGERRSSCQIVVRTVLCLRQRDLRDPLRYVQLRPIYMGEHGDGDGDDNGGVDDGEDTNGRSAERTAADNGDASDGGDGGQQHLQLLADVAHGGGATLMSRCGAERLVGVTVLVATANDGYVYQFSTNGECFK